MMNKKDNSNVWNTIGVVVCAIVICVSIWFTLSDKDIVTSEQYIKTGEIVAIHGDVCIVDVGVDVLYEFYGSDLSVGQRIAVRMDDNSTTEKIADDKVVDIVLIE